MSVGLRAWVRQYGLGVLSTLLLVECIGLANVRARDPGAKAWRPGRFLGSVLASGEKWDKSKDLKVGQVIPRVRLAEVTGRAATLVNLPADVGWLLRTQGNNGPGGVVLVFLACCAGCGQATVLAWDRLALLHPEVAVVLVTSDSAESVRRVRAKHQLRSVMLRDEGAKAAHAFRAEWLPRAYLIDPEGRVLWVQGESRSHPAQQWQQMEAVLRAAGPRGAEGRARE